MDASGPNAEQITYWNEQSGPKWVSRQATLDRMIAPFGERVMAVLALQSGDRVIDVGCGCGGTTLELGRRVTARGEVLGVDISEPMLARASDRAAAERLAHVRFLAADAQTHRFAPQHATAVFSRFGVMFFGDPTSAFANLHAGLAADGRLGFVCWQPVTQNPWMLVPLMAVAGIVPLPPPPAPDAPGPFSFGDRDRVARILAGAAFRDVVIEAYEPAIAIGGGASLEESVQFVLELGPTSAALRDASPEARARVPAAVRDALAPFATDRGVVMPSAAWVVTTRR